MVIVPYKRREIRLQNFTQWKMLLQNNTQHYSQNAASRKDKPHVLIAKFLDSLFHNSNFKWFVIGATHGSLHTQPLPG